MIRRFSITGFFDLAGRQSTVGTELRGAVATFLTMSYILFVNAQILQAAKVPMESAIACTAAAAAICCVLMGIFANFPIALASGMGLNAFVANLVVTEQVDSWQTAMGLVVLDGLIILVLVLLGLRQAILTAIPRDLRYAIAAGIGLFIAFIGLSNATIVVRGTDALLITHGKLNTPQAAIAVIGLLVIAFLMMKRVKGAIVLGILVSTVAAMIMGTTTWPTGLNWPSFENALQADVRGAMSLHLVPVLLSLVLVDFFDTLGTVTAVAEQAGLQDREGKIPAARNILLVDSISASIGGLFGASSVTSYIESAAGVAEGARTGLHSVFVGLFFLLAIFAAPLAGMVPAAATAPALVLVGFLMCSEIVRIDFQKLDTAIPAYVIVLAIPLTYSISHGIGYGFIVFVVLKLLSGKFREVHPLMYVVAAVFAASFAVGAV